MTKVNLIEAHLWYGTSRYEVEADHHNGLPLVFDFDRAEDCALRALRAMSLASGGHPLRDCRVLLHRLRGTATVSANGATAHYGPPRDTRTKLTAEEAVRVIRETVVLPLGIVGSRGRR